MISKSEMVILSAFIRSACLFVPIIRAIPRSGLGKSDSLKRANSSLKEESYHKQEHCLTKPAATSLSTISYLYLVMILPYSTGHLVQPDTRQRINFKWNRAIGYSQGPERRVLFPPLNKKSTQPT